MSKLALRSLGVALLAGALLFVVFATQAGAGCNPPGETRTELTDFTVKDTATGGGSATATAASSTANPNPGTLAICDDATGKAKIEMSAIASMGAPKYIGWRIEKATGGASDLIADGSTGHADPNEGKVDSTTASDKQSTLTVTRGTEDVREFYVKAFCDGGALNPKDCKKDADEDYYYDINGKVIEVKVVVLKVDLKELEFKQDNPVKNDSGATYSGADWQDNDLDGDVISDTADRRQPVSYKRAEQISVAATWEVAPTGLNVSNWRVRGTGPDGIKIGHAGGGKAVTLAGSTLSMAETTCDAGTQLPNTVKYYSSFEISWELSLDGGATWPCSADKSDNLLYVTYGEPQATMYHTLLHIGCSHADPQTVPATIVNELWGEFTDRIVKKVEPKTGAYTGSALKYWGTKTPMPPTTTAGLLSSGDGRCGAWARFLRDAIKIQGITADVYGINPIFVAPIGTPAGFTVKSSLDGQGPMSPPAEVNFVDHAVVYYNSIIYDSSYGAKYEAAGSTSALAAWENVALDSIGYVPPSPPPPLVIVPHTIGDTEETSMSVTP